MKSFFKYLRYIPGFRSDTKWKKIIATIYYIFSLLMLTGGLPLFLFMSVVPFIVFYAIDLIKNKIKGLPIKKTATILAVSCLIFAVALANIGSNSDTEYTVELSEPKKQIETSTEKQLPKPEEKLKTETVDEPEETEDKTPKASGLLKVHYIDAGQADAILIQTHDGKAMLIDAGTNAEAQTVVNYIKQQNVSRLDFIVGTHPHEDHIGGMVDAINNFDIGKVIMPKIKHNTQTFLDTLAAIENKGLKITQPVPGTKYKLGDTKFTIVGPNSGNYEKLNDYSVVIKLDHGKNSFLFTGDAESTSENEIVSKGHNIKSDILKVGHHGSDTSTTSQFLQAVSPKYAVISVGPNNKYGHPSSTVINRLSSAGIKIFRTDKDGTIIAKSDGESITFGKIPKQQKVQKKQSSRTASGGATSTQSVQSKPKPVQSPATDNVAEVYITNTGKKYHRGSCSSLRKSKIPISLKEAKNRGYGPCKRCHPPQ